MVEPYIGEIKLFSYNNIPKGWALCNGAIIAISTNQALFSLVGTTYGGNGSTTFGLPDLRGRTPVGAYGMPDQAPYGLGYPNGVETVSLVAANLPSHVHMVQATNQPGTATGAVNAIYAQVTTPSAVNIYGTMSNPPVAMDGSQVQPAGNGAPHSNIQPYLAMVYCIATQGVYPPRP